MPAPSDIVFSVASKVAAHTAFKDLIDAGSGPGTVKIKTAADVVLATIVLESPCGTVNGTTGQLVFSLPSSVTAVSTGIAAYGEIADSAGLVHLSMPVVVSSSAVSNRFALNSEAVVEGGAVSILSALVG
jgi:hypothetical protein